MFPLLGIENWLPLLVLTLLTVTSQCPTGTDLPIVLVVCDVDCVAWSAFELELELVPVSDVGVFLPPAETTAIIITRITATALIINQRRFRDLRSFCGCCGG